MSCPCEVFLRQSSTDINHQQVRVILCPMGLCTYRLTDKAKYGDEPVLQCGLPRPTGGSYSYPFCFRGDIRSGYSLCRARGFVAHCVQRFIYWTTSLDLHDIQEFPSSGAILQP